MNRRVSAFRSKNLKEKRRNILLYKYGGGAALLLALVVGLSFLTRAQFLRVDAVVVDGNNFVKKEAVEEIIKRELAASRLGIFSKNNIALYPSRAVKAEILHRFTAVESASVSFEGLKTILVKIHEHRPDYLWCNSETRSHCFFMDSSGFIFSEAAGFSSNVLFTYYGLVADPEPIGQNFLMPADFAELNKFIASLKLLKLTPIGLIARAEGDFEIQLSTGGSILFSNREPFLTSFENIETIINEQTRLAKDFLSRLDYIDVRFASKAFVKLK